MRKYFMHRDEDGKFIKKTLSVIYTTVDGKKHGKYLMFHSDETLLLETNYLDGKRHGSYTSWHRPGQYEIKCTYINGKLDGLYERWGQNGLKWQEYNYKNGKLDGICKDWEIDTDSLELCSIVSYKAGKVVEVLYDKSTQKIDAPPTQKTE